MRLSPDLVVEIGVGIPTTTGAPAAIGTPSGVAAEVTSANVFFKTVTVVQAEFDGSGDADAEAIGWPLACPEEVGDGGGVLVDVATIGVGGTATGVGVWAGGVGVGIGAGATTI